MKIDSHFNDAIKIFLIYLFKILVFSYASLVIIERVADYGLKSIKGSVFSDWERLLQGEINSELVILGSSRGSVGYDPKIIGHSLDLSSFNLSFNGAPHNLQYLKFNLYLKRNQIPDVIIQNVDLNHFATLNKIPEPIQFIPLLEDSTLKHSLILVDPSSFKYSFLPLFKYNRNLPLFAKGIISSLGIETSITTHQKGYLPIAKPFQTDQGNLYKLQKQENIRNLPEEIRSGLTSTFSFFRTRIPESTKIYFIWAPEYQERLKLSSKLRKLLKVEIEKRIIEMPNAVFMDFSDDPISQNSKYFYDTFHLNRRGSQLFSKKLSSEIAKHLEK